MGLVKDNRVSATHHRRMYTAITQSSYTQVCRVDTSLSGSSTSRGPILGYPILRRTNTLRVRRTTNSSEVTSILQLERWLW